MSLIIAGRGESTMATKPMRLEATVPKARGEMAIQVAKELGMSRSQLVDDALALYLKVVREVKRGRRVVTVEPGATHPACELSTPALDALEWALEPAALALPVEAIKKMRDIVKAKPEAGPRLRAAASRRARRGNRSTG